MRYCTICGQEHDSSACPPKQTYYLDPQPSVKTGWKCPVCGLGNAPAALKCGHCKPTEITITDIPGVTTG